MSKTIEEQKRQWQTERTGLNHDIDHLFKEVISHKDFNSEEKELHRKVEKKLINENENLRNILKGGFWARRKKIIELRNYDLRRGDLIFKG